MPHNLKEDAGNKHSGAILMAYDGVSFLAFLVSARKYHSKYRAKGEQREWKINVSFRTVNFPVQLVEFTAGQREAPNPERYVVHSHLVDLLLLSRNGTHGAAYEAFCRRCRQEVLFALSMYPSAFVLLLRLSAFPPRDIKANVGCRTCRLPGPLVLRLVYTLNLNCLHCPLASNRRFPGSTFLSIFR